MIKRRLQRKNQSVSFEMLTLVDPSIPEISTQAQLDECLKKAGVCLISFLTLEDEYQESKDAHAESILALSAVKKTFFDLGSPFTFVWVNAISHGKQLINDFGVRYLTSL